MQAEAISEEPLYHKVCRTFSIPAQDAKQYSPLTLAYIGDAIYEVIVRTVLVEKGNAPVNTLHKRASKLVKAEAQKEAFFRVKELLSEEEMAVFKRGRNAKSYTSAKMPQSVITGLQPDTKLCLVTGICRGRRTEC